MADQPGPPPRDNKSRDSNKDQFRRDLVGILPHLRAFARGLCGRPDYADDLVQETLVRAWAAQDSFRPGTSVRAWTFTILRNQFLNDHRRSKREVEYDPDLAERTMVEDATQESRLHMSDLERALLALPEERREALLLVTAGGFSYQEASEIAGVAVGTMKSRVARGRAALVELIEGEGGELPPLPATEPAVRKRRASEDEPRRAGGKG